MRPGPPGSGPPSRYVSLMREIDAAMRRNDILAAAELAEQALAAGGEHPGLLNLVAYRHIQNGELGPALARLERARALAPRDVNVLNTLGNLFRRMGRLQEARETLDAAATIDPRHATVLFNLGAVLEDLGDREAARAAYERTISVAPDHAQALGRLSYLAAMRGDYDGAQQLAARAMSFLPNPRKLTAMLSDLARQRGDVEAAVRLAELAVSEEDAPGALVALALAEFAAGDAASAKAKAETSLADPALTPVTRALAHGLLGDIAERAGNPANAFAHFTAANDAMLAHHAPAFEAPAGGPRYLAWVEDLAGYFAAVPAESWRAGRGAKLPPDPARGHVFLVGFPRSGTTLLEGALGASGDVVTGSEVDALHHALTKVVSSLHDVPSLAGRRSEDLDAGRDAYWSAVMGELPNVAGKIYLDKLPLNTTLLGLVAKLFPSAKILFALRDPRDAVFSAFRQRFSVNWPMYEFLRLDTAARLYDATMRIGAAAREKFDLDWMDTRYDDLVRDFEGHMHKVCEFTGVPWRDEMRDVAGAAAGRNFRTPSREQMSKGLFDGTGKWKRYEAQLAPVLPILAPWVERFGYAL